MSLFALERRKMLDPTDGRGVERRQIRENAGAFAVFLGTFLAVAGLNYSMFAIIELSEGNRESDPYTTLLAREVPLIMTGENPSTGGEIRRFIGLVLIVIGALWIIASGLCSGGFLISLFATGGDIREAFGIIPMIVLVGGISAGFGFGLYAIGRALRPSKT